MLEGRSLKGRLIGRIFSMMFAAIFIAGPLLMVMMPGIDVSGQRPSGILNTTSEGWGTLDLAYNWGKQPLVMNLSISKYWDIQNATIRVSGGPFITDVGTQIEKISYPENPQMDVGGSGTDWAWKGVLGQQTKFHPDDIFVDLQFATGGIHKIMIPLPAGAAISNITFDVKHDYPSEVNSYEYKMTVGNSDNLVWYRSDAGFSKGPHIATRDPSTVANVSVNSVCVDHLDFLFDPRMDIVGAGNNGELFIVRHDPAQKSGYNLNPVPILLGQGNTRGNLLDCAMGDYNQDIGMDLAVSTSDGKMYILTNYGNGGFQTTHQMLSLNNSRVDSITMGDINGDGWGDIVGGYLDGQFWVSTYNVSKDSFNTPYIIRAGTGAIHGLSVSDFELDGRADIIGASENRHWYILKNNGTALNMTIPVSCGTASLTSLAVTDLNWDNFPDLISGSIDGSVYVAYNLGEGKFSESQKLRGGAETMKDVVTTDVNLDGSPDILALNGDGWVYLYRNDNGNLLEGNALLRVGAEQNTLAVGDLNNDNALDLVTGGKNGMDIYWNTYIFQNETIGDDDGGLLKGEVQKYLDSYKPKVSDRDEYGNVIVDVPINISSTYRGDLWLRHLNVTYSFKKTIDIKASIINFVTLNKDKADHEGYVNVPVQFMTDSAGRLEVSDINIVYSIDIGAIIDSPVHESRFNMSDDILLKGHSNLDLNCSNPLFHYNWLVDSRSIGTGCQLKVNVYQKIGGAGDHVIELRVQRNPNQEISFTALNVTVLPSTPPNVYVKPNVKVVSGKDVHIKVQATDSDPRDQGNLTYGIWSGPKGMTINRTTGDINWSPGNKDVGTHAVVVNVSDGKNTTMATFNVKVEAAPHPIAVSNCFAWPVILTVIIVGLAFGVVFVETEIGIFAIYSLAFLLYTRLKQEMVLDNFVRGQVYAIICENPGLHLAEIQRRLKISAGTLIYHIKTLERESLVKSYPNGGQRIFFSSKMKVPSNVATLTKAQRLILKAIEERPGISQKELAESTGLSDSTVNRIVHELQEKGLLMIEKGKTTQCYLVDN